MVLISLLWACSISKAPLKSPVPQDLYMISSLDQLDTRSSVPIPETLQKDITNKIAERGLQLKALTINDRYSSQRNSGMRSKLYTERPLLLIETQAQFFSQLEGRFRWTVEAQISLLAPGGEIFQKTLSIPVFHQFHHQREKESLEAAREQILRSLDRILDDYIRGIKP